ncbi:T9SS type A sorting domain-containing protein [Ferruginibacter sp. HRS2-29]|uniref:T9SS type A sorting domain-containing protein n=1 Tax=Ferruginibacter sp. HRS2-29 TaxID=2487334 RepID=UPI0020CFE1E1|nr:T9SS type A sorting domain-containing protein [Ferruginibacter sp. HRS2-29]MCP9751153.1 T9SS C-terminal target domain-containing protein [Ferruginibacter sp. HRS2-29]
MNPTLFNRMKIIALAFCLLCSFSAKSQLVAGDIAFTGYNSNNSGTLQNDFSFILLVNIAAGTTINFTDNGYKIAGINSLNTIEGTLVWTSTTAMARFTQVYIRVSAAGNSIVSLSAGSIAGGFSNFILTQAGDQILAYTGTSASPTFISAIHMNSDPTATQAGWDNIAAGTTFTQNRSDVPPGLTSGVNCVAPDPNIGTSEKDNGRYNCTGATGATLASIRTSINTPANWSIQDFTNYTLPPTCTFSIGILPLRLLSFEGKAAPQANNLTWSTAEEINVKRFVIERSENALDFSSVGTIPAKNLPGNHQYQFADNNIPNSLPSYYRLKMEDIDGLYSYSSVVLITKQRNNRERFFVYRPAANLNALYIRSDNRVEQDVLIEIIDFSGRKLYTDRFQANVLNNGNAVVSINMLNPGSIYILQIKDGKTATTWKFIK